jgi:hypothetical protein
MSLAVLLAGRTSDGRRRHEHGPSKILGKRQRVPGGGPELQLGLGIAVGHEAHVDLRVGDRHVQPFHDLRVAAVEPLGQPDHRAEQPHDTA